MGTIEAFSTEHLPPRQRRHFWSEITSRTFTPLESKPRDVHAFNACLRRASLGSLSLSQAESAAAQVIHTADQARKCSEPVFLVHLQTSGTSVNRQDGREAVLSPGDFTLCDSTRPYSVSFDEPTNILVLRVPARVIRERLVDAENLTALRIAGSHGVGGIASSLMRRCWTECTHELEPQAIDRLGTNILDLLVTALCVHRPQLPGMGSLSNAQYLRARYFVEDHLTDPELDVNMIAAALRITPRYVHRLFEHEHETVGQYIQRRRLETAMQRLKDPAYAQRSILTIAYDCGFSDGSYFGRVFRRHFGITPGEARQSR